jgi:hypothetical protein
MRGSAVLQRLKPEELVAQDWREFFVQATSGTTRIWITIVAVCDLALRFRKNMLTSSGLCRVHHEPCRLCGQRHSTFRNAQLRRCPDRSHLYVCHGNRVRLQPQLRVQLARFHSRATGNRGLGRSHRVYYDPSLEQRSSRYHRRHRFYSSYHYHRRHSRGMYARTRRWKLLF